MSQLDTSQPRQTFRGTWDQVLAQSAEIPKTSEVELRVFESKPTATMLLMKAWLEEDATDNLEEIVTAEEELLEFKRNMNLPRKEAGMRLLYPEADEP